MENLCKNTCRRNGRTKFPTKAGTTKALIFDFDGLILNTELAAFRSWQEVYRSYGLILSVERWAPFIGGTGGPSGSVDPYDHREAYEDLESQARCPIDRDRVRNWRRYRYKELIGGQPPLPGVENYIVTAKRLGLKLGIASSSPRDWLANHRSVSGLIEYFDVMKCSNDVSRTKPAPDLYHAALTALGIKANGAVVLEDSPVGVTAAKRAGIFCVAVPNELTRQLSLEHADFVLGSLADMSLERLLDEVESRKGR